MKKKAVVKILDNRIETEIVIDSLIETEIVKLIF